MGYQLPAGIALFVLVHSINLIAPNSRRSIIDRVGLQTWKLVYSLIALVGFYLMVVGYAEARMNPTWVWQPPLWTRHASALLTLPAFILLVAAYIPGNRIKAKIGHPMYLSVKLWAAAHLLANGGSHDIGLFGALLLWSVLGFAVSRRRDRAVGLTGQHAGVSRDATTLVLGLAAWAIFAMWLHKALIGISPFAA